MKKMTITGFVLIVYLILSTSIYPQLSNSSWPIFQHDASHTGRSEYAGPSNVNLAWTFETEGWLSAPVIGPQGIVYVGSSDSTLYALKPDGNLNWSFRANSSVGTVCVGFDGTIFFCTENGNIHALNDNGTVKWSYSTGYNIYNKAITMDPTGVLYFGSEEKKVYALNTNGSIKWELDVAGYVRESITIGGNGTIYATTIGNEKLYAINQNGTVKWKYDIPATNIVRYITSPVLAQDGTIYFGTGWPDNGVYALDENGTFKWKYTLGYGSFSDVSGPPALGADGTIYFGSQDNNFYAINGDGTLKWSFETGGKITASPVIDSQGTIFFGSDDGKLYALNSDGSLKWSYMGKDYSNFNFIAINSDGTMYISSELKLKAMFNLGSGTPDLNISSNNITFSPENQSVRGSKVTINAEIHEGSNLSNASFDVNFYYTNKTNLIGTIQRYILSGSSTKAQIIWNTESLSKGNYDIIVEVKNSNPSETNISNNEAQSNYTLSSNLQDRIDNAVTGDTVWVEPGTYYGCITLRTGVVVKSRSGPKVTILDGQKEGTVVSAPYLDKTAILDGFTITNGDGTSGGGIGIERGGVIIRNNIITGNSATWGGGVYMIGSFVYPDPLIERNVITNNEATWGDAIYANNSWGSIINNTIVKNGGGAGDGINAIGFYSSSPTIKNCICWGNGDDLSETAIATYSCIQNGDLGTGNISSDPLFVNPENGNFQLLPNSPCIDTGDPDSKYNDVEDSNHKGYALFPSLGTIRNDMGAFGGGQSLIVGIILDNPILPKSFSLSQNYPNPFNPNTKINYSVPKHVNIVIKIFDVLGKEITTLVNEEKSIGNYEVEFNAKNLSSGIYFYQLKAADFIETKKMILLR